MSFTLPHGSLARIYFLYKPAPFLFPFHVFDTKLHSVLKPVHSKIYTKQRPTVDIFSKHYNFVYQSPNSINIDLKKKTYFYNMFMFLLTPPSADRPQPIILLASVRSIHQLMKISCLNFLFRTALCFETDTCAYLTRKSATIMYYKVESKPPHNRLEK